MGGQFNDALAQNITIKGKVTDATTKLPIDYAAVVARGANLAEMTDAEGAYEINVAPGTTLEYSCLGYISKTIKVTEDGVQNVSLETDAISLDAVVAIGYGTTKRSDVTGAVSSVTADELKVAPVATVDQAMQGRVAGVTINAQSGQPGQAAQVRIRGVGTVNNSSPIYVVDGVITEDISFLNSADVASMEILKDASSSAIYGSRGANGVIIITTKSGAEGKVKVSFDCYVGVQNIWRTLDLMRRDEYVETMVKIGNSDAERKELKRGFTNWLGTYRLGRDYYATPETFSYETQETDWQAEVQHKNAAIQNYHISVDGGTDKIKYSLSAGYFAQDGTIKESFYNRLTLRTNASYEITKWLKLGTNLSYITSKSRSLGNNAQYNGVLFQAISMAPWDPTHYPAGTLSKSGEDISGKIAASTNYTNVYNPFTQLETSHPNNTDERLLANGYLEIKPWEWLTFKSSISMNRYSWQNRSYREKYHSPTMTPMSRIQFLRQWDVAPRCFMKHSHFCQEVRRQARRLVYGRSDYRGVQLLFTLRQRLHSSCDRPEQMVCLQYNGGQKLQRCSCEDKETVFLGPFLLQLRQSLSRHCKFPCGRFFKVPEQYLGIFPICCFSVESFSGAFYGE